MYLNFTVTLFILLFFKSTFTTSSGSSSALCPVSIILSSPFSVTIACVTHFLRLKSKYCTFIFSISWSSSPSFHSSGSESSSSTSFPSLSASSDICALFITIGLFSLVHVSASPVIILGLLVLYIVNTILFDFIYVGEKEKYKELEEKLKNLNKEFDEYKKRYKYEHRFFNKKCS